MHGQKGNLRKLKKAKRRQVQRRVNPSMSDLKTAVEDFNATKRQIVAGKSMNSAFTNEPHKRVTWSPSNNPISMSDLAPLIRAAKAIISSKKSGTHSLNSKPIIIDSGASHHMISDRNLISDVRPALGNVIIANGDKVKIEGIGNLKLFDRESPAFYMPNFVSNLLSVRKATIDLNCQVVFRPNDVEFQDLKTGKVIGEGNNQDGLYHL
ncbi:hypothetical protein N665_0779s0003 [Sinapis alba]|nr:hypothetical protein N665_0779s0003 [Sinapis alba]